MNQLMMNGVGNLLSIFLFCEVLFRQARLNRFHTFDWIESGVAFEEMCHMTRRSATFTHNHISKAKDFAKKEEEKKLRNNHIYHICQPSFAHHFLCEHRKGISMQIRCRR